MRKRPATLTSSLLARKGEAEPARLNDGTVPKDVIALQEELVARVAADISRSTARVIPGTESAAEAPAAAPDLPPPEANAASEAIDVAEAQDLAETLGSAPIELPPGSADEPDYDPAEDAAAQKDSQVTLADWTARAQSGDTPFAYERMTDAEEPERPGFIPLALGVTVAAVIATLAIWQLSDHGQLLPQGMQPAPAETATADTAPPAAAVEPPAPPAAAAKPAEAAPAPTPAKAAPAPAKAEPPAAAPVADGYAVQLISTISQETAEAAWTKISGKVTRLGFKDYAIERADLGAKGVRYRVQLTGFTSYAAGQKACATLKANKLSCLVLRQ